MGEPCTQTHCQRGKPIGWGAIKTHCTEMYSVAESRRLNSRVCPQPPAFPHARALEEQRGGGRLKWMQRPMPRRTKARGGAKAAKPHYEKGGNQCKFSMSSHMFWVCKVDCLQGPCSKANKINPKFHTCNGGSRHQYVLQGGCCNATEKKKRAMAQH